MLAQKRLIDVDHFSVILTICQTSQAGLCCLVDHTIAVEVGLLEGAHRHGCHGRLRWVHWLGCAQLHALPRAHAPPSTHTEQCSALPFHPSVLPVQLITIAVSQSQHAHTEFVIA